MPKLIHRSYTHGEPPIATIEDKPVAEVKDEPELPYPDVWPDEDIPSVDLDALLGGGGW